MIFLFGTVVSVAMEKVAEAISLRPGDSSRYLGSMAASKADKAPLEAVSTWRVRSEMHYPRRDSWSFGTHFPARGYNVPSGPGNSECTGRADGDSKSSSPVSHGPTPGMVPPDSRARVYN